MRKLLLSLFLFSFFFASAQQDTVDRKGSVILGLGSGAGFYLTKADQPFGYSTLLNQPKAYVQFRADLTILWKEKIGFRLQFGRIGRVAESTDYEAYAEEYFPGYQYLPEYSELSGGLTYTYFCPQFAFKKGNEPFNVMMCGGIGFGSLKLPGGYAVVKVDSSNMHRKVNFIATDGWNMHAEFCFEFGYMRQVNQHWFCNMGIYVNGVFLNTDYRYTYGEQDYGQPVSFFMTTITKYMTSTANVGVFLNFQWNKRESERAIYE